MPAVDDVQGNPSDLIAALWDVPLFRDLPEPVLTAVASRCRVRTFERGAFVFHEGQPAESIHILLRGHVKVIKETPDGQEVILRLIQPGEIFGGAGGWGEATYPATGMTIDDSLVVQLPAASLAALLAEHPEFAMLIIRELGTRLREAESRIRELQAERAERRIARTLLRLASKTGTRTAAGIEIGVPLSRQNLAELSGTTLSTASRILSAWDRQGVIVAGRERVTVVKPHQLVVIADELDAPSSS